MSVMIPNLEEYFRKFVTSEDSFLSELETEALKEEIPIIGPVVGELLSILVTATQAKRILELGTAIGYSTVFLAKGCEAVNGKVITLEMSPGLAERARANFRKKGIEERTEVMIGDAREMMLNMNEPFDFIFLDIDKDHYLGVLDQCHRLLKRGGLLFVDNIGFKDADNFNQAIFDHPGWRSVHLLSFLPFHSPEKDGLCLALRI